MSKYEEKLELGSVSSNVVTLRGAYHYASTDLNIILQVGTNFGHPTLNSSFTKYRFLQVKNSCATIVLNGLSVPNLFQLSKGDLSFRSMPTASTNCANLE